MIDLIRKKFDRPKTDEYPSLYSPPTYIYISIDNPDIVQVYFCNEDESSCLKITEEYLEPGEYSIGFQKLGISPGKYIINFMIKDSTLLLKRNSKIPSLEITG